MILYIYIIVLKLNEFTSSKEYSGQTSAVKIKMQLTWRGLEKFCQVMFCCRHFHCVRIEPTRKRRCIEFLTTQTDQSKCDILIDYVLKQYFLQECLLLIRSSDKIWAQEGRLFRQKDVIFPSFSSVTMNFFLTNRTNFIY